jgi:hypothetical protein
MEAKFIENINCFQDGFWRDDTPYVSISSCKNVGCCIASDGDLAKYCSREIKYCLNKWRDERFYKQHLFESDTDYYPSDCDISKYQDKRVIKLQMVKRKPYHYSGEQMLNILNTTLNFADNYHFEYSEEVLNEIRKHGYSISIKKFKSIMKTYDFPSHF